MKTYIDYCPNAPVSINTELITVPSGPPYVVETEHNWIVDDSSIEIWENNDKSGTHLVEEAYDGSVSGSGKFQVDYLGASEGDAKYCNKIFFHADQGGLSFYVWYKTEGDVFGAKDANSKALKDSDAVENNLAKFDSSGNPVDSGIATSGVLDAVNKKHSQNTDSGTTSQTFQLQSGSSGAKLKNNSGVLEARNADDDDYTRVRGADPEISSDLVSKGYADSHYSGGGGLSLIQNGSFEIVDTNSLPWCWEKISADATVAVDTGVVDGYGGANAIKITSAGDGKEGIKYTFQNLKPSTTYAIRIWMKATAGDTAACWTTGGSDNVSVTSTNTTGEYKTDTFTTDATPTDVVICIGSETNGDIVWFDALTVVEGSSVDKYLPSPEPIVLEFQDFYPIATAFPGLETLVGTNILKKYVYALDDTTEEPLGFNFSIPPRFDPSGSILIECVGWAKTAAANKNIEFTYYYSPSKYGEDWDSAYSNVVSGDLALYSAQDYRDNLRFQLSINTAGFEAYDVVESKISRTAPSANNLSGDYYFEKLRLWIPRV